MFAFFFLILLALFLCWSFQEDFESKQREWLFAHWPKGADANNYVVTINSIDLESNKVNCSLRVDPPLVPKWEPEQIFYGPLNYSDLTPYYAFVAPHSANIINRQIWVLRENQLPFESFSKSPPLPIYFSLDALGKPEFYPFDRYFIMGAIACQSYVEKGNERQYVHIKKDGESLSIINSARGLFIRNPTKSDLDKIKWMSFFSMMDKKIIMTTDEELKELNNNKNRFALIMQRSIYLRGMTVILGIFALVSAIYVGFITPFKEIPLHVTGLIIALWGIRNILMGDFKVFPTYFDYTLLGIYLVLFGGIAFRTIKGGKPPNRNRPEKQNNSQGTGATLK